MKSFMLTSICLLILMLASCKKTSTPTDEAEHEAINGVELIFKKSGTTVATFTAEDPDGDGGNPPTRIDKISLQPGQTYTTEVVLRNIVNGVSTVVTGNVSSQSQHHEFYYLPSGISPVITKTDKDINGYPVGINTTWVTNTSGTGTMLLKLMHKPRIKGPNDDPSKGHTDIAITFPLEVK
jgi:hypothetical protein